MLISLSYLIIVLQKLKKKTSLHQNFKYFTIFHLANIRYTKNPNIRVLGIQIHGFNNYIRCLQIFIFQFDGFHILTMVGMAKDRNESDEK